MADSEMKLFVNQDSIRAASEEVQIYAKGTKRGELCIMDWYTEMALEGRIFMVRFGLDGNWSTGDQPIASTKAEAAADAGTGITIIPFYLIWSFQTATGTLSEVRAVSVAAVSSAGDAFVPQNLYVGGPAPASTARCDETGGVTVTAEAEATAMLHYDHVTPIVVAANATPRLGGEWRAMGPPILTGPECFYVQVAGTTTAPEYCLSFKYVELPTANVS